MTTPDEPDMTAAELALGVLDGPERAAALRRVLADPAFAREVEWWRDRLATFHAEWPDAEPRPELARRVAAIPDGGRRPDGWARWAAAGSSIAAALLLGVLLLRPDPRAVAPAPAPAVPSAPVFIAVITPEDGKPFGALFDPRSREVRVAGTLTVPTGRDAELWAIGADGVPRTAGLLSRDGAGRIVLARTLRVGEGTVFAISIEPLGGSPKPTPTGPVVAQGTLSAI